MSRIKLQRRLTTLERRRPVKTRQRTTWDLACFTVEELEAMVPLAEKYEAVGGGVAWTPAEVAVFERLAQVEQRCHSSS